MVSMTGKSLHGHENGEVYLKCMLTYTESVIEASHIDTELVKQLKNEQQLYWSYLLKRIVAVVKVLSSRGLPFKGVNQTVGSKHNANYLECLKLISKFDPFLSEHLKDYGHTGKDNPSHLSAAMCEEFITLIANNGKLNLGRTAKRPFHLVQCGVWSPYRM